MGRVSVCYSCQSPTLKKSININDSYLSSLLEGLDRTKDSAQIERYIRDKASVLAVLARNPAQYSRIRIDG